MEDLIYCKDCKFWHSIDSKFGTCERERWTVEGQYKTHDEEFWEDYCSHAERRKDG